MTHPRAIRTAHLAVEDLPERVLVVLVRDGSKRVALLRPRHLREAVLQPARLAREPARAVRLYRRVRARCVRRRERRHEWRGHARREDVLTEEELLDVDCVALLGACHIFVDLEEAVIRGVVAHRAHISRTFEIGRYRLRPYCRIARESSTMKTANAAFSKSVGCTSIERNSTRQPIGELAGGGLKRTVCQLVDWIFWKDYNLLDWNVEYGPWMDLLRSGHSV
jgi:hypothetical protein